MEALRACYEDSPSDSDTNVEITTSSASPSILSQSPSSPAPLLPPPIFFPNPPNSLGSFDHSRTDRPSRVRSFPHVEGSFALHVYIPVGIPSTMRKELAGFLERVAIRLPGFHVVEADVPLRSLLEDCQKLEEVALGRVFHISLGRTVPIRGHQRESIVTMLRHKLQFQRNSFCIDFGKWEAFVNDDRTRTFLSLEVKSRGLAETAKQIQAVNGVYKLHNLPEFYKDPRPHISIAWALGDVSDSLKRVIEEEMERSNVDTVTSVKPIFTGKFSCIECKIGKKTFVICKPH